MAETMRQVVLASHVRGAPVPGNFALVEAPLPTPGPGEVLLKTRFLSLDPLIRFALDEKRLTGIIHLRPGDVIYGGTVGEVVASNNPAWPIGSIAEGRTGWREYAAVNPDEGDRVRGAMRRVEVTPGVPVSLYLGALGMPGQTAHAGMIGIGRAQAGETVVVSAAGGAVGTIAGQIGRILGCRMVGIAGGPAKCAALAEWGYDAAVDYKAPDFAEQLKVACPDGIDVYLDNVGGDVTLAVLPVLKYRARMPVCGFIAWYGVGMEGPGPDRLPGFFRTVMSKGLEVRGFGGTFVGGEAALVDLARWHGEGRLRAAETIVEGLENAAAAFCESFASGNAHLGKVLVRV